MSLSSSCQPASHNSADTLVRSYSRLSSSPVYLLPRPQRFLLLLLLLSVIYNPYHAAIHFSNGEFIIFLLLYDFSPSHTAAAAGIVPDICCSIVTRPPVITSCPYDSYDDPGTLCFERLLLPSAATRILLL